MVAFKAPERSLGINMEENLKEPKDLNNCVTKHQLWVPCTSLEENCSVCFCTGHFVMVPINLTCSHCLQHSFFLCTSLPFIFDQMSHLFLGITFGLLRTY